MVPVSKSSANIGGSVAVEQSLGTMTSVMAMSSTHQPWRVTLPSVDSRHRSVTSSPSQSANEAVYWAQVGVPPPVK